MDAEKANAAALLRSLRTLALANALVWMLSIIALTVVLETEASPKGLFVLLAGGLAVGGALHSALTKAQSAADSIRQ